MPILVYHAKAGSLWKSLGRSDIGGGAPFVPPSTQWPVTNATTGWRGVGLLTSDLTPRSGNLTVTTNGAVLDKMDSNGGIITVNADNVIIKRSRITSGSSLLIRNNGANLTVQDCELAGTGSVGSAAIGYGNFTALRNDIYNVEDGLKGSGSTTIRYNLIHNLYRLSGTTHNDGIQISNGSGIVIQYNNIQNDYTSVSCVFLKADQGPITDVLVDSNLLSGGGYTVYGGTSSTAFSGSTANIRFTNNRFRRNVWPNGGNLGVKTNIASDALSKWLGNVWDDTGEDIL